MSGLMESLFGGSGQQSVTNPDQVAGFQQPFLQQLFGGGQQLSQQLQPQFQGLGGISAGLGQQGQGFLGTLGQAGQGLNQFTGTGPLQQQISGVTGLAQNFLNQNLNQIQGGAQAVNQGFGSRVGVEQGAAIGQASAGLGGVIGDIFGQDIMRRQQATGMQEQLQSRGAMAGLSSLNPLMGLAQQGLLGQFGGLQSQQGLVGSPIVLGQGGSGSGSQFGGILPGMGQFFSGIGSLGSG